MSTQRLFMNVYRAGFYHRQGKPGHCNIHPGDCFPSEELARANIEAEAGYIATVGFDMPVPDGAVVLANPEGSEPTPLHVTRSNPLSLMPWHTEPHSVPPVLTAGRMCPYQRAGWDSLETVEDPLGMSYEEWKRERERTGLRPLPKPHTPKVPALFAPLPEAA